MRSRMKEYSVILSITQSNQYFSYICWYAEQIHILNPYDLAHNCDWSFGYNSILGIRYLAAQLSHEGRTKNDPNTHSKWRKEKLSFQMNSKSTSMYMT